MSFKTEKEIVKETIKETEKWSAVDWKDFRKTSYKDYFNEKDELTFSINRKDPFCLENMNRFKKDKLLKIKEYNKWKMK
jgi:hypothetical protein